MGQTAERYVGELPIGGIWRLTDAKVEEMPFAKDLAGVDMRLEAGAIR